jgi:hypothetical protein
MRSLVVLLFLAAQPFWETKPADKWTDREIDTVLHASPWVQVTGASPEVYVYFATAEPVENAEAEWRLRSKKPLPEPDPDYLDYLREHGEEAFVLAIPYETAGFGKAEDQHRMEDESEMKAGGRSYKIVGYFPPTPSDPVLRLIFPRQVRATDKTVDFQLYLPGISFPDREVQFRVKDLYYKGKLAM